MPTYTDQQITDRMGGYGPDVQRKQVMDALFARAQAGDASAISDLNKLAGLAPGQGAATMDAKNYDRMLLGRLSQASGGNYTPTYGQAHDGGGGTWDKLGSIAKIAGPIAAMAIPGLGPVVAGGIAAGSHALGSEMQGGGLDPLGSLETGGAVGLGRYLLNRSGSGSTPPPPPGDNAAPSGMVASPSANPPGYGNQLQTGGGSGGADRFQIPAGVTASSAQPGTQPSPSMFGIPGLDFSKLAEVAGLGLGVYGRNQQRNAMTDMYNKQLGIQQQEIGSAERNYASKAPYRNAAMANLSKVRGSSIFGA